jgi:hypothetical protein
MTLGAMGVAFDPPIAVAFEFAVEFAAAACFCFSGGRR